MTSSWYSIANAENIPSPSVLIYPDRIRKNLQRMITSVGGAEKLRPHVKTHKLPQVVQMKLEAGITRFKTSTIAETEMVLQAGGKDVLMAYQPVGPNIGRLIELIKLYPDATIAALVDNEETLLAIASAAHDVDTQAPLYADLNVGMNRTGIVSQDAMPLYRALSNSRGVTPAGLHAYDGHLHQSDHAELTREVGLAFAPAWELKRQLEAENLCVPNVVAAGTPTSHLLAKYPGVEVSTGTSVLWDAGQPALSPTLDYLNAAVLLCRVISRPAKKLVCIDLGHKAVASEFEPPRVRFYGLEQAVPIMHSEEHLVLQTDHADEFPPGTVLYGIPYHICPTIALHQEVWCVEDGNATEQWPVIARNRRVTV